MKNFRMTEESIQLSILEQKNSSFTRKSKTPFRLSLFLLVVVVGGFALYANGSLVGGDTEIAPQVKGEIDIKTSSDSTKLVSKYNLPIAVYTPVKKESVPDLVVPNAHASIIIDVDSGTILHYDDGDEERQIASLTKIMTAILVIENIDDLEKEKVVIDEEAVYVEGTKIGCPRSGYCIGTRLKVGETITARELLTAMLMNSTNDAAIALAKHIGGTQEKFAEMMNEKARELGLKNSSFCTASGLEVTGEEERCYSSAYDIARIAAYSMQYKEIWDTFLIPSTTIYSADNKISHDILNTNALLDTMPECLGAKTGFTPLAGYSLMLGATDRLNKHRIIVILLDDPYRWEDARMMVNWAFDSYEWK